MKFINQIYQDLYKRTNDNSPHNCDKGTTHSYIEPYESLLANYSGKIKLLEIGVDSGVCLLLWKEVFSKGKIIGCDISSAFLRDEVRQKIKKQKIDFILGNICDPKIIDSLPDGLDVIIDDGSHILSDQLCAFELLKDKLSPKGTYIIEDLQSMSDAKFMVDKIPNSYIIDLRHIKNRYDDIMVVLKKY